ncbi:MAG: sulfite exporter TauE/SafE family protein [Burkholderiales bacterium]|nr:sulfite exporter TauE/SafE family protein [Burkholderiales bacterium]MDP2396758.1 sulfite exporter TauE/SafE family protein [Burkholderiales bacterium]MDP3715408.1 sulfite exporter TauE/SafE family protein [Burkholderiales bacterium]
MDGWLQAMMLTAFGAGLLGGAHCAAMCGGIVSLTCTPAASPQQRRWRFALAYNAGRISSYVLAGALAGALGQAGMALRGGALAQHLLMFLMGATLIVVALNVAGVTPVTRGIEAAGGFLWRRVQPHSRRFLPVTAPWQALGLGALWGWLPCGMVYAVLLTALASGNAAEGALILGAFGLGTLPNLLLIGAAVGRAQGWMQLRALRYAASAVIAAVGIWGMLHVLQPAARDGDSLLCRVAPGLAELLR